MIKNPKRTFVLVHGAWHGGWVWRDVMGTLGAMGHATTTLTLTGVGERHHTGNGTADLATHVQDVVAHIEMEGLRNVTLVGWSYGGAVITGALARIPERVRSMIYLDAFAPQDGKALVDYMPADAKAVMDGFKSADSPLPPYPLQRFGVTDPRILDFVTPRLTPQPWRTFYQPVSALRRQADIPLTYICCTGYGPTPFTEKLAELKTDPHFRTEVFPADHLCMLSRPAETCELLAAAA